VWNIFKTLSDRDSARLRRLEKDFALLADDVELCMNTIPKIHAKLRMRATRAAAAEIEAEDTSQSVPEVTASDRSPVASTTKLQLRELARSRGFLFPQRRQETQ
jgi:hypothetical protein